jgi:spore coat protein CotH
MSTVLYSHLARPHIAAPRANFVRVVINGESWGTYVSVEQFNADFVKEHFGSAKGARWKVKGSPNGASGLDDIGDDLEAYKRRYQIKSKDRDEDWKDLANLCRVLSTTPIDELEEALKPILDIDGALWFLALDVALVNSDGYWVRASDYSIYKDPKGVFHIVPHDMNEAFASGGGRGGPRGPGGPPGGPAGPGGAGPAGPRGERPGSAANADGARDERPRAEQPADGEPRGPRGGGPGGGMMRRAGVDLDPLVGMDDERKPLRSRLLAVPSLRAKYLEHVRELARDGMDWEKIGPVVAKNRALLMEHVKADTRKASSLAAFETATSDAAPEEGRPPTGLRGFFERRRAYLLEHAEIKKLDASAAALEQGR